MRMRMHIFHNRRLQGITICFNSADAEKAKLAMCSVLFTWLINNDRIFSLAEQKAIWNIDEIAALIPRDAKTVERFKFLAIKLRPEQMPEAQAPIIMQSKLEFAK